MPYLLLLIVSAFVEMVFISWIHHSKKKIHIDTTSKPHDPLLLALLVGLGVTVIAIESCGELPGVFGASEAYVVGIKSLGVIVFASINGAAGVAVYKHFGGTNVKALIATSAVTYLAVFSILLGVTFYEYEKAELLDHLWFRLLQKIYKAMGSPVLYGAVVIIALSQIFLTVFCGILATYLPVAECTTPADTDVPVWASSVFIDSVTGMLQVFVGVLCVIVYEAYDGQIATTLKVLGGIWQAISVGTLAILSTSYVSISYGIDDWQWRSFNVGGFAGIFWGIGNLFASRPEDIKGGHPQAVVLSSILRGIVYSVSYGTIALLSTFLFNEHLKRNYHDIALSI